MLLKKRNLKFEMYDDVKGEYRWRLKAGNGAFIADSGESYVSESYCKAAIEGIEPSYSAWNACARISHLEFDSRAGRIQTCARISEKVRVRENST